MMNILLTRPIANSSIPWYFPSGLGYIAAAIRDAGHTVRVLDPEVESGWDLQDHIRAISEENFDVLGISALINKYDYVRELTSGCKKNSPGTKVVLGGNITGPIWELLLNKSEIDVLVVGEGERTIVDLLDAFSSGRDLSDVEGIAYRKNGKAVQTKMRQAITNLDDIPLPAFDLFPMEKYLSTPGKLANWGFGKKDISIITSRGCPYQCTFCYRPPWEVVRHRSMDNIIQEVRHLVDVFGADSVVFNDELTLWSKKVAYQLCDEMAKVGISWGCVGRVNIVDQQLLAAMYKAGCRWVTYGIESGSQEILKEMKKNTVVNQAKNVVKWTIEAGIKTNPTFIIGYPSETYNTAMETVKFIKETGLRIDSFFFATPYPGTELYENAVLSNAINEGTEDFLRRIDGEDAHDLLVNLTSMSDAELIDLKKEMLRLVKPGVLYFFTRGCDEIRNKGIRSLAKKILKMISV